MTIHNCTSQQIIKLDVNHVHLWIIYFHKLICIVFINIYIYICTACGTFYIKCVLKKLKTSLFFL